MRLPSKLLPVLLLTALPLAGCAADQGGDAASPVTIPAASETSDGSGQTTDTAAPAATASPTADAAERDRDERDESSGTDARPGAVYDCREVDGTEVCDTFGESDEGPGTYDDSDEGPGTH